MLPLLLFQKAFCLLQFHFSYAYSNFSFKGIIRGPSTTFNFLVSFFKLRLYCPCCVFCFFVCGVFWVIKFLLLLRACPSFGDEAVGGFWDTPRVGVIPLGLLKLPSLGFLGFVTGGLSNLQVGISYLSRVLLPSPLEDPQVDLLLLFFCL